MTYLSEKSFHVSLVFCSVCSLFQTGNLTCEKALVSPGLMCCTLEVLHTHTHTQICLCINMIFEVSQKKWVVHRKNSQGQAVSWSCVMLRCLHAHTSTSYQRISALCSSALCRNSWLGLTGSLVPEIRRLPWQSSPIRLRRVTLAGVQLPVAP